LIKLCERCGQLLFYPDSGEPPVVLDAWMDAEKLNELYDELGAVPDGWHEFFERAYGDDG
jgi:hypothetical protein